MKTIIALSGLPGSGKTTYKHSDPLLKGLPFVDVAEIYAELNPIDSADAFAELLRQASESLETNDTVVIEATLARGSWQRPLLEGFCKMRRFELSYIDFDVDPEVCYDRVMAQYNEVYPNAESDAERLRLFNYYNGRINILTRAMPLR